MSEGVLVRFGEIGIKSPYVRRAMTERLRQNLLDGLLRRNLEGNVVSTGSRLWMEGPDPAGLLDVARTTFGVVSASRATTAGASMEDLQAAAVAASRASPRPWTRFAIRARREGSHAFTSQDIAVQTGSAVFRAAEADGRQPIVDLEKPELEVFIDVRGNRSYVHLDRVEGPGGLPVGSQGRVVAVLDSRDAAIAAWLMMRRGCDVVAIASAPRPESALLARWGMHPDVRIVAASSRSDLALAGLDLLRPLKADAVVVGDILG